MIGGRPESVGFPCGFREDGWRSIIYIRYPSTLCFACAPQPVSCPHAPLFMGREHANRDPPSRHTAPASVHRSPTHPEGAKCTKVGRHFFSASPTRIRAAHSKGSRIQRSWRTRSALPWVKHIRAPWQGLPGGRRESGRPERERVTRGEHVRVACTPCLALYFLRECAATRYNAKQGVWAAHTRSPFVQQRDGGHRTQDGIARHEMRGRPNL